MPQQITSVSTQNVMNVYYITDDDQTMDLTYKVEYYKDGEQVVPDAHNRTITVQVLNSKELDVIKDDINIVDKYIGFRFEKIEIVEPREDAGTGQGNDQEPTIGQNPTEDTTITLTMTELPDKVKDDTTIKVYYKSIDSQIIVKYVDIDGNEIENPFPIDGKAYQEYNLYNVNDEVKGYDLISKTEEGVVKFAEEPRNVIFTYSRKAKVIVNHIDKYTGQILDAEEIDGHVYEEYTAEEKTITGYALLENMYPDNFKGKMTVEPITVNYYYMKPARVIVRYLEINTDKELAGEELFTGYEGDVYNTEEKVFLTHSFLKVDGHKSGYMTPGDTVITYYYAMIRPNQGGQGNTGNSERQSNQTGTGGNNSKSSKNATKKNANNTEKKNIVKRIVSPGTGDPVPVIAYGTIALVILSNIIVYKKNRAFLKKEGLNPRSLEYAVMKRQAKSARIAEKRWKEKNKHGKH